MKKFLAELLTQKGETKTVTVWLDDETARLLEKYGDEKLKHKYLIEEYKEKLIERRETRRHQSLEEYLESGCDFADSRADTEQFLENLEERKELHKALKILTDKQVYILKLHVLKKKTFKEISGMLGINPCTVKEHYYTAQKKLKKFFK